MGGRAPSSAGDGDWIVVQLSHAPFGDSLVAARHALDERADVHVHVDTQSATGDADGRNAVFDTNRAYFAREEITLLHNPTPSGAPGMFGPSECEPEHSGDGRIERAGKLQVNAEKLTYVGFTVLSLSPPRDRNSNNAVICDHRSSRDIRASGVAL